MNRTRESAILRSGIWEIITPNEPRTGTSVDQRMYEELDLLSP